MFGRVVEAMVVGATIAMSASVISGAIGGATLGASAIAVAALVTGVYAAVVPTHTQRTVYVYT
ncbi:MAG TPA: hypothetical protein V6D18_15390 [Thermosynechococcaceae cyanobacterium]